LPSHSSIIIVVEFYIESRISSVDDVC